MTKSDLEKLTPSTTPKVSTGITGLNDILGGGLTANRMYLVEGPPGAGKTTLALQFLLDGAARGESSLYITLSETSDELRTVAATHGWSLDGLAVVELLSDEGLDPQYEQSILHPAEVELGETMRDVLNHVENTQPVRMVFDSLSELRLLSQNPLRFRRQILALKRFMSNRQCTVLLLDNRAAEDGEVQLHSIAHGVISLERTTQEYGSERRRLRVVKMRGIKFRGGFHDFTLDTGGIDVFPRLVAAEHHADFVRAKQSTGSAELDTLLGGGLTPGSNILLTGPSGAGKTTTAMCCIATALKRGERCVYYLFDETLGTLLSRLDALGLEVRDALRSGLLTIRQIDPAELSPGEFTSDVRVAVEDKGVTFVAIDSLNAYQQAMPGEKYLLLQMHELLSYLNQQGVTTILILGQHGIIGSVQSDIDVSYLSDAILLFRYFETHGQVLTAVSAVKSRASAHERTIRQFRVKAGGIEIGEALHDFEDVMSGLPTYRGYTPMLGSDDAQRR